MRPPRQIGWVISVEDWALIRRLVADGVPQRQVARQLGIGRSTVARAVASQVPPKYERKPAPTSFSPFEPRVRELLAEHPEMPASVIAERVEWDGSPSWFRENVARLRPHFRRPDPADRLSWAPGDAAQCDLWFPPARIPLEDGSTPLLPVLVITAAHSRFTAGRMIPTRTTEDLLLGSWELIRALGPGAAAADLGQRVRDRPRRQTRARGRRVHRDTGHPQSSSCGRATRNPRASWNGATATSRPRSCPAACSPPRRTSTPSSPAGWTGPTGEWCARSGPGRST